MPDPAGAPTCDTEGVILPIIGVIASIQSAEALKLLVGRRERLHRSLIRVNVWNFETSRLDLSDFGDRSQCPACGQRRFDYLRGTGRQVATSLCGRNAVQIARAGRHEVDLAGLAERLKSAGEVVMNEFLLRFRVDQYDITVFRDSRSIIRGTDDPSVARSIYARYIGV
jgi:adenylyltransferase/sulfurtransferase